MAIKKIEIQDHNGNIYHPHTDANVVFTSDGKTVEEKLESLKQSVSSGKDKVAKSITDKGVPTLATDTFDKMATNINNIKSIEYESEYYVISSNSSRTAMKSDATTGAIIFSYQSTEIDAYGNKALNCVHLPDKGNLYGVCHSDERIYSFDGVSMARTTGDNDFMNYPCLIGYDGVTPTVCYSRGSKIEQYTYPYVGTLHKTINCNVTVGAMQEVYDANTKSSYIIVLTGMTEVSLHIMDKNTGALIREIIKIPLHSAYVRFNAFFDYEKDKIRLFYTSTNDRPIREIDFKTGAIISENSFVKPGTSVLISSVVCTNKIKGVQ